MAWFSRSTLLLLSAVTLACAPTVESSSGTSGASTTADTSTGADPSTTTASSAVTTVASSTGPDVDFVKGEVDEAALIAGITVTITTDGLGFVRLPFSVPVPDVPDEELQAEMLAATSLLVTSNLSGASADLMAGLLTAAISNPGDFTWGINPERTEVILTFINQTPGGLVLTPGSNYTTQVAITTNDYVQRVSAISFQVTVVDE